MKSTALIISLFSIFHQENEIKTFGFYSNERSNDGEHSIGYTLQLWEYKNTLVGKVSYNESLIGDHASALISNVKYDPSKKTLSFETTLHEESVLFNGKLTSKGILGAFIWPKYKDRNQLLKHCCADAEINKDYSTIKDWYKMWDNFR